MSDVSKRDAGPAIVTGIAAAIAGYIPAVVLWVGAMKLIRPQQHAEEAMGRGLEAMFIGGPAVALAIAILAGWLTYRSGRITLPVALAILVGAVVATYALGTYTTF